MGTDTVPLETCPARASFEGFAYGEACADWSADRCAFCETHGTDLREYTLACGLPEPAARELALACENLAACQCRVVQPG